MWTKVQKSKLSPTPHAGPWRAVPAVAGFPSWQSGASVTPNSWLLPLSHLRGLHGSEWHSGVFPA